MVRRRSATLAAISIFALGAACTQVLGIEEARVDPTSPESLGSAAGSAGSSSSATAGATADGGTSAHDHLPGEAGANDSGAGTTPSSAGSSDGAGGAPSEPGLCERYCDKVTANCKGKYEQYRTFDQCIQVCKQLPGGEAGDQDVNSVECRVRQADFAESEPFVYCKSAGPLGAGKCGSNCVSYCSMMQTTCTADSTAGNLEPSYFDSSQSCLSACGQLPEGGDGPLHYSSSASAEPSSFVGDTIFCRTYHLAAALEQDTPDEHCPHAMGGDPCIPQ